MSLFYNRNNIWYYDNLEKYEKLKEFVDEVIRNLVYKWSEEKNLFIEQTDSRIKEVRSFLEKIKKKSYIEATDVEDFLGARIICYTQQMFNQFVNFWMVHLLYLIKMINQRK